MTVEMMDRPVMSKESEATHTNPERRSNGGHGHDESSGAGSDACRSAGLKGVVEALLFVSGEPVSVERLASVLEGPSRTEVIQALRALQQDYAADDRGLQVVEIAGGYQITTRVACAMWIKKLEKAKASSRLSRSAMETLAIVAYKQPLVRAEIEQIRGVDSAGVLKTLLDRRLVRILGRKDIPGRPILYGTTKQFLQNFGLKDLSELPALRDIKDLGEPDQATLLVDPADLSESLGHN
jgi:segregation and condensation protein B